jgi:hypothetical protein
VRVRRLAVGTAVAFAVTVPASAAGDAFEPTRFDDPPPNGCKSANCSLREAAIAANKSPEESTIRLGSGTYRLEQVGDGTTGGDVDVINSSARVLGEGVGRTQVSGESFTRVFEVGVGQRIGRPEFLLRGMTVTDGFSAEDGGGLLIGFSDTSLNRMAFRSSQALRGGGVAARGAQFDVKNSTFAGNIASYGGGLFLPAASNPTEGVVRASTFSGNEAGSGGGLSMDGLNSPGLDQEPELRVVNTTFAGNRASNAGGGVSVLNGAAVALDNSTVALNKAQFSDGTGGAGGGISQSGTATFEFADSLLAANSIGSGGSHPQCFGTFTPGDGANLLANMNDDPCSIFGIVVPDAMIGPLAKNGGPTKTVKLLAGSPAIGLAETCPAKDQRGKPRPDMDCDTGAFERKGP